MRYLLILFVITFWGCGDSVTNVTNDEISSVDTISSSMDIISLNEVSSSSQNQNDPIFSSISPSSSSQVELEVEESIENIQNCIYSQIENTLECNEQVYETTTIGDQIWLADNLNFDAGIGSYCNKDLEENCDTYGRLYDWKTAVNSESLNGDEVNIKGVCPLGWHMPSNNDWDILFQLIAREQGLQVSSIFTSGGLHLKANSELWTNKLSGKLGIDTYGFKALPGASWTNSFGGGYNSPEFSGSWWSSSAFSETYAYYFSILNHSDDITRSDNPKVQRFSVRCIKD